MEGKEAMQGTGKISRLIIFAITIVAAVLLVVGAAGRTRPTLAAPPALPPRPGYNPGGSNELNGSSGGSGSGHGRMGAHIELQAQPEQTGLWSVVQWQDSGGGWHDVEGWRGLLEANGCKRWWVAAKDFGTGPFQWVVYRKPDSQPLAVSDPFNLPPEANRIQYIEALSGP